MSKLNLPESYWDATPPSENVIGHLTTLDDRHSEFERNNPPSAMYTTITMTSLAKIYPCSKNSWEPALLGGSPKVD